MSVSFGNPKDLQLLSEVRVVLGTVNSDVVVCLITGNTENQNKTKPPTYIDSINMGKHVLGVRHQRRKIFFI